MLQGGCGAIRRDVFLTYSGFDQSYLAIEDIELGYRLVQAKRKLILDKGLLVKHLKRWTFLEVLKSDIRDRAIPWTLLILRERQIPNDLNTQWSQRLSVVLAYVALLLAIPFWPAALVTVAIVIVINQHFYRFLIRRRGLLFGLSASPLHLLYFLYGGAAFATAYGMWSYTRLRRLFHNGNIHAPISRDAESGLD